MLVAQLCPEIDSDPSIDESASAGDSEFARKSMERRRIIGEKNRKQALHNPKFVFELGAVGGRTESQESGSS